jgi:hypothetical protein
MQRQMQILTNRLRQLCEVKVILAVAQPGARKYGKNGFVVL